MMKHQKQAQPSPPSSVKLIHVKLLTAPPNAKLHLFIDIEHDRELIDLRDKTLRDFLRLTRQLIV